ncbi:hypothetical protein ISN44_As03g048470 [Arabidopsis suecica]|uniref:F-box associated beta-propeller type 3 domain-containing protein n=1 Tax=Arabidopsis suecica TaxID=45249 RepID=A0A8T2FIB4_ARASU|nr:hypothetical protein ISN44_As03g048470 [Arabidopsis suecica]
MMTRGCKENSNETSPSPTLLLHGGVNDIPLNTDSGVTKNTPGEIALLRFKSVSKLWSSIISSRRDFIESIVTRFLTQPPHDAHFIFGFDSGPYVECFLGLSSTYPPNTDIEAVLSIPGRMAQYVYGLMCCLSGFKDAKKETQGWSRIFFHEMHGFSNWRILGATCGGEILFAKWMYCIYHYEDKLLCVLYYEPKRNSMRGVDVEGTLPNDTRRYRFVIIWTIPDHVQNTMYLY